LLFYFLFDEEESQKNINKAITCIVVELKDSNGRDIKGLKRSDLYPKATFEGRDVCSLSFEDVMVPLSNVLGERGLGMAYIHRLMSKERAVIACHALAASKVYLDVVVKWSKSRVIKGKPMIEVISKDLAVLRTDIQITSVFLDSLIDDWEQRDSWKPEITAMLKYKSTEIQKATLTKIMEFFGAYGLLTEFRNDIVQYESPLPVFKAFCNSAVQTIYGGSNAAMLDIVAKSIESI